MSFEPMLKRLGNTILFLIRLTVREWCAFLFSRPLMHRAPKGLTNPFWHLNGNTYVLILPCWHVVAWLVCGRTRRLRDSPASCSSLHSSAVKRVISRTCGLADSRQRFSSSSLSLIALSPAGGLRGGLPPAPLAARESKPLLRPYRTASRRR
jgi:hypothetical protein